MSVSLDNILHDDHLGELIAEFLVSQPLHPRTKPRWMLLYAAITTKKTNSFGLLRYLQCVVHSSLQSIGSNIQQQAMLNDLFRPENLCEISDDDFFHADGGQDHSCDDDENDRSDNVMRRYKPVNSFEHNKIRQQDHLKYQATKTVLLQSLFRREKHFSRSLEPWLGLPNKGTAEGTAYSSAIYPVLATFIREAIAFSEYESGQGLRLLDLKRAVGRWSGFFQMDSLPPHDPLFSYYSPSDQKSLLGTLFDICLTSTNDDDMHWVLKNQFGNYYEARPREELHGYYQDPYHYEQIPTFEQLMERVQEILQNELEEELLEELIDESVYGEIESAGDALIYSERNFDEQDEGNRDDMTWCTGDDEDFEKMAMRLYSGKSVNELKAEAMRLHEEAAQRSQHWINETMSHWTESSHRINIHPRFLHTAVLYSPRVMTNNRVYFENLVKDVCTHFSNLSMSRSALTWLQLLMEELHWGRVYRFDSVWVLVDDEDESAQEGKDAKLIECSIILLLGERGLIGSTLAFVEEEVSIGADGDDDDDDEDWLPVPEEYAECPSHN